MNTLKDKGVNGNKIILDLCGGTGAWIFAEGYGIIKL